MSHFDFITATKKEAGSVRHVPYTHLLSPTLFECRHGQLGSVIAVEGAAFDTASDEELTFLKQHWHDALCQLDESFCLYVTLHRKKEEYTLEGQFNTSFLAEFDSAYHAQFKTKAFYKNDLYITVLYKGITEGKVNKGLNVFNKVKEKTIKEARNAIREKHIKALNEKVSHLLSSLRKFSPRLLGKQDDKLGYSELLSFLSVLINTGTDSFLRKPLLTSSLQKGFKSSKDKSYYPDENLSHFLSKTHLYFGQRIVLQGVETTQYAAILSIKQYPTLTSPFITDKLLQSDGEFILSNAYFPLPKEEAKKRIKRHRARLMHSGDEAQSQIQALDELLDKIAAEEASLGDNQVTLLVLSQDKESLEENCVALAKALQDAGIVAIRETVGQMPGFWSLLPGNQKYMARLSAITSENFVDFSPLHNYRTGYKDKNHLSSAVTLLSTPSLTPFYFNFHAKGSANNPSKGHYIMVGGNDSGKTAMLAALDAQFSRYGGRSIFFDRDRGLEIYVNACSGYYSILSPNYPENVKFNPLQLEDTPANRQFCREWLAQLVKNEQEHNVPSDIQDKLNLCVQYAFDDLEQSKRRLSHIVTLLPIDFPRWPQLKRWLKSQGGEYDYIFDNDEDVFTFYDKMGFDLTHFFDNEPASILAAIIMYIFYRIEIGLDGRVTHLSFDEGWQALLEPALQARLLKLLPTGRKRNLMIGIATQSVKSIIDNPISHTILDNIATQIYFPNSQAREKDYCEHLHVTSAEFAFIKEASTANRPFLVKQGHESTICKLQLGHLEDYLAVFSGNTKTIHLAQELRQQYGNDPHIWLPLFHQKRQMK